MSKINNFDRNSILQTRKIDLLAQLLLDKLEDKSELPLDGDELVQALYRIKDMARITWQQIGRNDPGAIDEAWGIKLPRHYVSPGLDRAAERIDALPRWKRI